MAKFKPAKYNVQEAEEVIRKSSAKVLGNINKYFVGREDEVARVAKFIVQDMRYTWALNQNIGSPDAPKAGAYWHNWTYVAVTNMFFKSYRVGGNIGFYGYYGSDVFYAGALEEKRHALETMMNLFSDRFLAQVERIYGSKII